MQPENIFPSSNRLEINVGAAKTVQELHDLLFDAFQLSRIDGNSWDAFDKHLHEIVVPDTIQISNFHTLRSGLPQEAEFLSRSLEDINQYRDPRVMIRIR